jgi:hypothetical protein
VLDTTRVFVDPDIPEAQEFKNRFFLCRKIIFPIHWCTPNVCLYSKVFVSIFGVSLSLHGIDSECVVPLIGTRARPPLDEEFLRLHPKKTVSDLYDIAEDGIFAVCGTIVSIVGGQEWWYPACKCHKGVIADSGAYYCNSCAKHIFQVVPR